jgi:hypothetical protein
LGFVYLIRNGNLHKIGRTDNLGRRMKQLQPDEILQVMETDRSRDLEYELHKQFKAKRLPQTEYFRLNEPDLNLVRMALGWEPGDRVSVPPLHELNGDVAEARAYVHLAGIATGVMALTFVGDYALITSGNLLTGLLGLVLAFVSYWGFVFTSGGLLVATANYGMRWGWHKLRQRRG